MTISPPCFMPNIIRRKREGETLTSEEIQYAVTGIAQQTIPDSQIAAFAMTIFYRGMQHDELTQFTQAMAHSGEVLNWSALGLSGPVLDKHSTGGVGDKVTLILVPLITACGAFMPKMSGRALGHSGGTIDKLESIPGYTTQVSMTKLQEVVRQVGCAIVGSTGKLAPADKTLYAIRDVTATVDSLPLIVASILSKKLAANANYLVLDVKFGSGALLETFDESIQLANELVNIANSAGLPTRAVLTDMNQVLGFTVGHALEVQESLDFLCGKKQHPRLREVVMALGAEMLVQSQLAATHEAAQQKIQQQLDNGRAVEIFAKMINALGGPTDFIEKPAQYLAHAEYIIPVYAEHAGYVNKIDVRQVGFLLGQLKGARSKASDSIDYAVGFADVVGIGEHVSSDKPLAIIHANDQAIGLRVAEELRQTFVVNDQQTQQTNLIHRVIK